MGPAALPDDGGRADTGTMRSVTRNVEIDELDDLLRRPGRAALGWVADGLPVVVPARLDWTGRRWRVGLDRSHGEPPAAGEEVVLVVDEGRQFFDLRAAYVRGRAATSDRPGKPADDLVWMEIRPTVTTAWDYGRMRFTDDDDAEPTLAGGPVDERGADGRR